MSKILINFAGIAVFFLFAVDVSAQEILFNYNYKFEPAIITEPPQLGGLDVSYPEAARKNGVEGTLKASATLGADGKVRDIVIANDLGHGVGAAVTAALQKLYFKPAAYKGTPTEMKITLDYVVSVLYDENDKNVTKPKIVDKPLPPYPPAN